MVTVHRNYHTDMARVSPSSGLGVLSIEGGGSGVGVRLTLVSL